MLIALLLLLALAPVPAVAVEAGEEEARLDVRITGLSPSTLAEGRTVTLSGTITNRGEQTWTSAQAYLVAPQTPFTTRQQIRDAVEGGFSYTGERRIALDSIDEVGTLTPGRTSQFSVRVPYEVLNVNGGQGVYPVGVQILGTSEDGTRSGDAIGRATTFLPLVNGDVETPAALVVPFVMPDRRGVEGRYVDPANLVERVSTDGQLRNLLDLATSAPPEGTTVIVDPALLVGLDDLAAGRRLPDDVTFSEEERQAAATARDDLVALARSTTTWVLDYGRPDVLAMSRSGREGLQEAISRATATTLARFGLSGRPLAWPSRSGVSDDLVADLRGRGDRPVLVNRVAVPDWEARLGSLVTRETDAGPVPLLVDAGLDAGVPGATTVTTLRQRMLSEAALGALEREFDPTSRADAVAVVDPGWDPGSPGQQGSIQPAFDADFVTPRGLDSFMNDERSPYTGGLPVESAAEPLDPEQVEAVAEALEQTATLVSLLADSATVQDARALRAAGLLGIGWRKDREAGVEAAQAFAESTAASLALITVEGPPAVTLSSSEGSFPVTITNDSEEPIRVGLRLDSSNPRLDVPDVEPIDVSAGERRTLTVAADVGTQSSSTFTAQMVTAGGTEFGEPAVFNVRSSRVGAAMWVAMGVAFAVVVLALARRFVLRRGDAALVRDREETVDD